MLLINSREGHGESRTAGVDIPRIEADQTHQQSRG